MTDPTPPAPLSGTDTALLVILRSLAKGTGLKVDDLLIYGIGSPAQTPHVRQTIEHAIHFMIPSPLANAAQMARIQTYLIATGEISA